MRKFYLSFPICETVSHKLSWSHYFEILKADNNLEIEFYTKQCEKENWSVRELRCQMKSMLFHRVALSKDKEGVLAIANKGAEINQPSDIIKQPYVFEFAGIPEKYQFLEGELEEKLISNLEAFLLELGRGFAFVERQKRMIIKGKDFHLDLLLYHRNLKRLIAIDLLCGVQHKN